MNKLFLMLIVAFGFTMASCEKDSVTPDEFQSTPELKSVVIDPQEEADLIYMREEEKLARDVYLYAFDEYGETVFSKIANSEQTHMDKILELLNLYGIPDPAFATAGVFNDSTLQQLYYDLTALVDLSLLDAYIVGATIEDVDIHDLKHAMTNTSTALILDVYDNLACGSENHLRSFYANILAIGGTYTPQYITQQEFDAIINSTHSPCGDTGNGQGGNGNGNGPGNGTGNCNGTGTGTGNNPGNGGGNGNNSGNGGGNGNNSGNGGGNGNNPGNGGGNGGGNGNGGN